MTRRSLGIIVYADGSHAEIIEELSTSVSRRLMIPLPWPRELKALYLAQ